MTYPTKYCNRPILSQLTSLQYVTAGANPMSIKKGIDKTCAYLVTKLKEHAKPVKGRTDIKVGSSNYANGYVHH